MAVLWLNDVSADDIDTVGGKGASLGELTEAGLPVPPGFVVTAGTYRRFIENAGIDEELFEAVDVDPEDSAALRDAADRADELITGTELPETVRQEILSAYRDMGNQEEPFVAVRSSATAEDLPSIAAGESALIKVDGSPVFGRMGEIAPVDCTQQTVEVPSLTDDGIAWCEVDQLYEHPADEERLYRITTTTGREITVSPDHSLVVKTEEMREPETTTVEALEGDEKVPIVNKLAPFESSTDTIDVTEYLCDGDMVRADGGVRIDTDSRETAVQHSLPQTIDADGDFAYFLGLYVAQGRTHGHSEISLTDTNDAALTRAVDVMDRFGCWTEQETTRSLHVNSTSLVRFLQATTGKSATEDGTGRRAAHARVPEFVFGWDRNRIGQFLSGCFDGDGTVSDELAYATKSDRLLDGLTRLLELLGVEYRIEDEKKADSARILVPAYEANTVRERVGFESPCKSERLDNLVEQSVEMDSTPEVARELTGSETVGVESHDSDESVAWERIDRVDPVEYDGLVYDFSVPDAENFAAGRGSVITHNTASFAGQQETFLNVREQQLLNRVRECWASLFTQRAIYYRQRQGFPHDAVDIAVVVQQMVDADKSGVMFTSHPSTGDPRMVIEAAWGLGEAVVSGSVSPDNYVYDRTDEALSEVTVAEKKIKMIKDPDTGETVELEVDSDRRNKQVVTDANLDRLVELGETVETHYETPQDVEWAIVGDEVYMLQSRPITTITDAESAEAQSTDTPADSDTPTAPDNGTDPGAAATDGEGVTLDSEPASEASDEEILVDGLGASPGIVTGNVRIVTELDHLDQVAEGDLIVTQMTMPDMVPAMKRAVGIITDEGGMTSHAAIVSRELGVPAIVGSGSATHDLRDGQTVTMDGDKGTVREGELSVSEEQDSEAGDSTQGTRSQPRVKPTTATEVKVNVSIPEAAERAAATGADGVGLLRIEHMVLSLGKTPEKYIADHSEQAYVDEIVDGIKTVAEEFYPRPVRARTLDAPTDEFRELDGGQQEPNEHNPMLGWRGIRRSLDKPEIFKHEVAAFGKLYEMGYDNVELMLPLVNDGDDLRQAKTHMRAAGFNPDKRKWGVMIETPASALMIDDLIQEGIDFASFGTNDLTQYALAVDRNNEHVAQRFDELHPVVMKLISGVIDSCRAHDVDTSICGQAGSKTPMVNHLVQEGVSSISANIDAVHDVQQETERVEQRLLLDSIR